MKYERMLCWIQEHERNNLIQIINGQFSTEFVDNYEDFKKSIRDGDYLVISLKIAQKNIKLLKSILMNFQHNIQILLDEKINNFSCEVVEAFTKAEKRYHNYTSSQLVKNFMDSKE